MSGTPAVRRPAAVMTSAPAAPGRRRGAARTSSAGSRGGNRGGPLGQSNRSCRRRSGVRAHQSRQPPNTAGPCSRLALTLKPTSPRRSPGTPTPTALLTEPARSWPTSSFCGAQPTVRRRANAPACGPGGVRRRRRCPVCRTRPPGAASLRGDQRASGTRLRLSPRRSSRPRLVRESGQVEPGGRGGAVPQPAHGRVAPQQRLPEVGRQLPRRARAAHARLILRQCRVGAE